MLSEFILTRLKRENYYINNHNKQHILKIIVINVKIIIIIIILVAAYFPFRLCPNVEWLWWYPAEILDFSQLSYLHSPSMRLSFCLVKLTLGLWKLPCWVNPQIVTSRFAFWRWWMFFFRDGDQRSKSTNFFWLWCWFFLRGGMA